MGRKAHWAKKVAPFCGNLVCTATWEQLGLKVGAQRHADNPTWPSLNGKMPTKRAQVNVIVLFRRCFANRACTFLPLTSPTRIVIKFFAYCNTCEVSDLTHSLPAQTPRNSSKLDTCLARRVNIVACDGSWGPKSLLARAAGLQTPSPVDS